jgi:hypothetical protein
MPFRAGCSFAAFSSTCESVAVQLTVSGGIAAGERVPVSGVRVGAEAHVGEGAVVHVPGGEAVEAGVVVAEAHVVGAGLGVPALGVVAVGVVRLLGGVVGVGLVDTGEVRLVVGAVGRVAISGFGVAGVVGQGLDVGVAVVAVVAVLGRAVGVVLDLGEAFAPRAVLVRLGEFAGDLFVQYLAGNAEVLEVGGLAVRRLRRVVAPQPTSEERGEGLLPRWVSEVPPGSM